MKDKLCEIQNNKQYLEKKIVEYEKKLTELRSFGGDLPKQPTHPKFNNITNALLERVLKDSRK